MPNSNHDYAFKAFNKDIIIELKDYKYTHRPIGGDDNENKSTEFEDIYIGRENLEQELLDVLENGEENGAYLITGYRGMGKTSFVKKTIAAYRKKSREKGTDSLEGYSVEDMRISLNQSDLKEVDIFKQITKSLLTNLEQNRRIGIVKIFSFYNVFLFFFILSFLGLLSLNSLAQYSNIFKKFQETFSNTDLTTKIISSILSAIVFSNLIRFLTFQIKTLLDFLIRIRVNLTENKNAKYGFAVVLGILFAIIFYIFNIDYERSFIVRILFGVILGVIFYEVYEKKIKNIVESCEKQILNKITENTKIQKLLKSLKYAIPSLCIFYLIWFTNYQTSFYSELIIKPIQRDVVFYFSTTLKFLFTVIICIYLSTIGFGRYIFILFWIYINLLVSENIIPSVENKISESHLHSLIEIFKGCLHSIIIMSLFWGTIFSISAHISKKLSRNVAERTLFVIRALHGLFLGNIIYSKLLDLYNRCEGSVTKENSLQSSFQSYFGFIQKNLMVKNIANAKEIESEITNILNIYENFYVFKLPKFQKIIEFLTPFKVIENRETSSKGEAILVRKKFIFIIDELDKIEPSLGKGFYYDDLKSLEQNELRTYLNDLRERKQLIITALAALKSFVTEARARFIFVAGRDMYDAALADISDRQSALSSIFNRIFYVDSFLKSSDGVGSLSFAHLVSEYFQRVIGVNSTSNSLVLNNFYTEILKDKREITDADKSKMLFVLQSFIIFLTYRSNGSPKKLVKLVEECIVNDQHKKIKKYKSDDNYYQKYGAVFISQNDQNSQTQGKEKHYLFLSHDYQYKIGFISYLFSPFLTAYGNILKKYSDSILVSTTFLMDHLVKFHPFAFSKKNLEVLPEIISTNKTPEIRSFIEDLLQFLTLNHIRETEIGLFDYKFYERTHNEIVYLSKLFEEESAAFNFTLDESLSIKQHYRAKIKDLRSNAKDLSKEMPNSIVFLNSLLGDVYFYDQEYDDAVVSYFDALQSLDLNDNEKIINMNTINFIQVIHLKLKIGLCFERMKSLEMGLGYYADSIKLVKSYFTKHQENNSELLVVQNDLLQLVNQAFLANLYLEEKMSIEGGGLIKIRYYQQDFLSLVRTIENKSGRNFLILGNFYSSIATLLYYKNLVLSPSAYEMLNKIINDSQDEYDNKIIDIASFLSKKYQEYQLIPDYNKPQNADFNPNRKVILSTHFDEINIEYINKTTEEFAPLIYKYLRTDANGRPKHKDARISTTTYLYYKLSLLTFMQKKKKISEGDSEFVFSLESITTLCQKEIRHFVNRHDKTRLKYIASSIAKLGDLWLSVAEQEYSDLEIFFGGKAERDKIFNDTTVRTENFSTLARLEVWATNSNENKSHLLNSNNEKIVNIDFVFKLYFLSARYYLKAGLNSECSVQLRKILKSIELLVKIDTSDESKSFVTFLEKTLVKECLEISSWNVVSTDRREVYRIMSYMNKDNQLSLQPEERRLIFNNLSNNPDTGETLLLFAGISLKTKVISTSIDTTFLQNISKDIVESKLIQPEYNTSHQWNRIQELDLQLRINEKILTHILDEGIIQELEGIFYRNLKEGAINISNSCLTTAYKDEIKDIHVQITANSIFCLRKIIQSFGVFNNNYTLSYSQLANYYAQMGKWIKHYHCSKKLFIAENPIDKILEQLLGAKLVFLSDVTSQYQQAYNYYYKAIQMHSDGQSYRNKNADLNYLEDDYNDNLYHFGASIERNQINNSIIRYNIREVYQEIKDSKIFQNNSYLGI